MTSTARDLSPGQPWDVAVVGAGPAGSTLARQLSGDGRRVILLERERFPRDKLCGEFLSGESLRLLGSEGRRLLDRVRAATIERARFLAPDGAVVELELPAPSVGLRRRTLDAFLWEQAREAGVTALSGAEVRRVLEDESGFWLEGETAGRSWKARARRVIGAQGRRSCLDRSLDRDYLERPHSTVAWNRHFFPDPGRAGEELRARLQGHVEIHVVPGGYCGLNFVESGEVNACCLLQRARLDELDSRGWEGVLRFLCRSSPSLAERFDGLSAGATKGQTVANIPFQNKEASSGGILFVGDAAGVIAPLLGEGQSIALHSATRLGELLLAEDRISSSGSRAELARRWRRIWRREFARRIGLGGMLQKLLFSPLAQRVTLHALARSPALARKLAQASRS